MDLQLKKNNILLFSLIVFILAFSIRIYYITQKAGLHIDETLTATITSCKYGTNLAFIPEWDFVYTGKQLKELLNPRHKDLNNTLSDLKLLRENNCRDTAHPNLYYLMFKVFTFPAKQLDMRNIINYGCSLNLIIFCFSFILMYKLLNLLFKDNPSVIPLGLAVAFLNTSSISLTLFVRMYELQTLAAIFVTYVFAINYQAIEEKKEVLTHKNVLLFVTSSVICVLSGYFMGIYLAFIILALLAIWINKKQFRTILEYLLVFLLTATFSLFIYPGYFNGFHHSRTDQLLNVFTEANYNNIYNSLLGLISSYKFFLFYFPVVLLLLLSSFFMKKERKNELPTYLFLLALVWSFIIMFLAPEKILRYIAPVYPILGLIVPYIASHLQNTKRNILIVSIIFMYIFYALTAKNVEWHAFATEPGGFKYYDPSYDLFHSHIENIYKINPEFTKHPDIPVIFLGKGLWNYVNLIYYLNDKQKYEFHLLTKWRYNPRYLKYEDFYKDLFKYKRYYLLIGKNCIENPGEKGYDRKLGFENVGFTAFDIRHSPQFFHAVKGEEGFEFNRVYLIDRK